MIYYYRVGTFFETHVMMPWWRGVKRSQQHPWYLPPYRFPRATIDCPKKNPQLFFLLVLIRATVKSPWGVCPGHIAVPETIKQTRFQEVGCPRCSVPPLALIMSQILSSPPKRTYNSAGRFSATGEPPAPQLCREMDNEMWSSFVGPMPVKQFFQTFLPTPIKIPKSEKDRWVGFEKVATVGLENQMYDEFVRSCPIVLLFLHP